MKRNKLDFIFIACLFLLALSSVIFLHPRLDGDGMSYITSIGVLHGEVPDVSFVPTRILTTIGGLVSIDFLSVFFGSLLNAWLFLNVCLYFGVGLVFYALIKKVQGSHVAAFLSALFCMASYGAVVFGLTYLMDIGGWLAYAVCLFFLYSYSTSGRERDLMLAALAVGIGGLFKEYAFLGAVAIAASVISGHWGNVRGIISRGIKTALIALGPITIVWLLVFAHFHYSYADWFSHNRSFYVYNSRIIEYIKSLGSLVNLLAFPFLVGACVIIKDWKNIEPRLKTFIASWFLSFLPIFFWPAITQRILFITVPFIVLISSFAFKKYQKYWYWFLLILIPYILATFFMDSYILGAVNLPF